MAHRTRFLGKTTTPQQQHNYPLGFFTKKSIFATSSPEMTSKTTFAIASSFFSESRPFSAPRNPFFPPLPDDGSWFFCLRWKDRQTAQPNNLFLSRFPYDLQSFFPFHAFCHCVTKSCILPLIVNPLYSKPPSAVFLSLSFPGRKSSLQCVFYPPLPSPLL